MDNVYEDVVWNRTSIPDLVGNGTGECSYLECNLSPSLSFTKPVVTASFYKVVCIY